MGRLPATFLLLSCSLLAQGTPTRASVSDYPVRAALPDVSLAAEYMVRSVSANNRTFFIPDHLVVEVAVFPAKGQTVAVSPQHFHLRLNGKKAVLSPQAPGFVAASLKYPDWERRRSFEAIAGAGEGGVIIGRPRAAERFPGDPRPGQTRLPAPPRAPTPEHESGLERQEPMRADEAVVESELPQGDISSPASGYLYFPYKGKTKSIREVDLLYQGPAGTATLRLR